MTRNLESPFKKIDNTLLDYIGLKWDIKIKEFWEKFIESILNNNIPASKLVLEEYFDYLYIKSKDNILCKEWFKVNSNWELGILIYPILISYLWDKIKTESEIWIEWNYSFLIELENCYLIIQAKEDANSTKEQVKVSKEVINKFIQAGYININKDVLSVNISYWKEVKI